VRVDNGPRRNIPVIDRCLLLFCVKTYGFTISNLNSTYINFRKSNYIKFD
jgi:hypothetical protein